MFHGRQILQGLLAVSKVTGLEQPQSSFSFITEQLGSSMTFCDSLQTVLSVYTQYTDPLRHLKVRQTAGAALDESCYSKQCLIPGIFKNTPDTCINFKMRVLLVT